MTAGALRMRTVLTFCGVYVVSLQPAPFIGIQLVNFFHSQEEFIAILMALILFSVIAIVTFSVAYRPAGSARARAHLSPRC